jgi:ABC-2 type transport system permease protein
MARIVRHDWRQIFRDRTALVLLAVLVCATVSAARMGANRTELWRVAAADYSALQARHLDRYRVRAAEIERVDAGGTPDPRLPIHPNEREWGPRQPTYALAWMPPKVVLPPPPGAPLAVGHTNRIPLAHEIAFFRGVTVPIAEPTTNPLLLAFGAFDVALVFWLVYPLLVLALGADLLASERGDGTLALVLSQPLSLGAFAATKILARSLLLIAATIAVVCLAFAIGGVSLQSFGAARAVTFAVAVLAYGFVWLGLALVINVTGSSVGQNALKVVGCWLLLVVLVPVCLHLLAQLVHPTPSSARLINAQRMLTLAAEGRREALSEGEREALIEGLLAKHPSARGTGDAASGARATLGVLAEQRVTRDRQDAMAREFDQSREAQRRFVEHWQWLSPAALLAHMLEDLSGASEARERAFRVQAEAFLGRLEAVTLPRLLAGQRLTAADYARLPQFRFEEEAWSEPRRRVGPSLLLLAFLAAAMLSVGLRLCRRFQVGA